MGSFLFLLHRFVCFTTWATGGVVELCAHHYLSVWRLLVPAGISVSTVKPSYWFQWGISATSKKRSFALPSFECTSLTFRCLSMIVCLKYTKSEENLNEPHKSPTGRFEACDQQFGLLTPHFDRFPSESGCTSVLPSLLTPLQRKTGKLQTTL